MLNSRQLAAKNMATAYFLGCPTSAAVTGTTRRISENIMGWGIGKKNVGGTLVDAVHVYVRELPDPTIPQHFGELPTDVTEVGRITACHDPTRRHRPAPGGVSVGHLDVTAGTLGCLVEKEGKHYILSNSHILANNNKAKRGDPVIQPSRIHGGRSPDDRIAMLESYERIVFSDRRNPFLNSIDAAIALVGDRSQNVVDPRIHGIGRPSSTTKSAFIGQTVQKYGQATKRTTGSVKIIDESVWVDYEVDGQEYEALFNNQIVIEGKGFARRGDSGSLILEERTCMPVALIFATDEKGGLTYANPIGEVLKRFKVTIVGSQGVDA